MRRGNFTHSSESEFCLFEAREPGSNTLTVARSDDIDDATASRAYINPLSAMIMLERWNPGGKNVLITAAGSSCAALLAEWSIKAGARRIVGVYRSPEHHRFLSSQGIIAVNE